MKAHRAKALIRRVLAIARPGDIDVLVEHVEKLSKLSMDQIEELTRTDEGMRELRGPLTEPAGATRMPKFSEVVEAEPGPMTDEEFARVLSGGSRHQWGPGRRPKRT